MNPAIARLELTGDAAMSVSTCRWKMSPTNEPGAGEMMLTFGPGLCAQTLLLTVANATARNHRTRNGAIFTTASVHRPRWPIPLHAPSDRQTRVTGREGLKLCSHGELFAHNGTGSRYEPSSDGSYQLALNTLQTQEPATRFSGRPRITPIPIGIESRSQQFTHRIDRRILSVPAFVRSTEPWDWARSANALVSGPYEVASACPSLQKGSGRGAARAHRRDASLRIAASGR